MLFKLTGSSCSGKTTLALSVADRLEDAADGHAGEGGDQERA
jgi:adenylylsulfate kinase-like enzyme